MPQFKVGDWVENIRCGNQRIIKQVIDCKEHLDTLTIGSTANGINVVLKSDVKLWKPKEGEWCWYNKKYFIKVEKTKDEQIYFSSLDGMYINAWDYLCKFEPLNYYQQGR